MKSASIKSAPRGYSQTTRAQAAEETGRRILQAFLGRLLDQWFDEITLDSVAADAGVTVQTVIRRFGGKDGLLAGAVGVLADQINAQRATRPGDVEAMVTKLYSDYEKTGDMVIRLLALDLRHPAIKQFTDIGRGEHRKWVSAVLADSLEKLDPGQRQRAVDALVIVTDVYAWKLLRRDMGRSVPASKATMASLVRATLAQAQIV